MDLLDVTGAQMERRKQPGVRRTVDDGLDFGHHRIRIGARRQPRIGIAAGVEPSRLFLLRTRVGVGGGREKRIDQQMGIVRHIPHHPGDLQIILIDMAVLAQIVAAVLAQDDGLAHAVRHRRNICARGLATGPRNSAWEKTVAGDPSTSGSLMSWKKFGSTT